MISEIFEVDTNSGCFCSYKLLPGKINLQELITMKLLFNEAEQKLNATCNCHLAKQTRTPIFLNRNNLHALKIKKN